MVSTSKRSAQADSRRCLAIRQVEGHCGKLPSPGTFFTALEPWNPGPEPGFRPGFPISARLKATATGCVPGIAAVLAHDLSAEPFQKLTPIR